MNKMTAAQRKARLQTLQQQHSQYHDYNQKESARSKALAAQGHPIGKLYQTVADTFFSLYYCSNAATRLLASNHDGSDFVALSMPNIREPDNFYVINGEKRYIPHAARSDAGDFWQDFSAAGFPGSEAFVNCLLTSFYVKTSDRSVMDAIFDYVNNAPYLVIERFSDHYSITMTRVNGKAPRSIVFTALVVLLKKLFKPYLLRAPREKMPAETPFRERGFLLGNVQKVTVGPHNILVPLLSTHDSAHNLSVVHQIEQLLLDGYPFSADVEHFLTNVVKPTALKKMKEKFNQANQA